MTLDSLAAPGLVVLLMGFVCGFCLYRLRMLSREPGNNSRRRAERVFFSLILLAALAAAAGTTHEAVTAYRLRALYPPPGKVFIVNGYRMHLNCMGQGTPTVVLESGLGEDWLSWAKVQPALSKTTRICSYDRAGLGWSEPRPGPRDATTIADQLHALLSQAGVTGPLVLMGHSMGGLFLRAYITRYPQDIAGLVFVDSTTPLQQDRGWVELGPSSRKPRLSPFLSEWIHVLGIPRFLGECNRVPPYLQTYSGWIRADLCHAAQIREIAREMADFRQSGNETLHTGPFGAIPVLIFSRDPLHPASVSGVPAERIWQQAALWNGMQEDLKRLSTRSRRIIASGSGHSVQGDRPDLVIRAVQTFIGQLRGNLPQPSVFGTTTTE